MLGQVLLFIFTEISQYNYSVLLEAADRCYLLLNCRLDRCVVGT